MLSQHNIQARSACHKAALIHDVIADNTLDILLLTETWIPSDAPDAAKLDVAPSGYTVIHRHRAASSERRGGGLTVIHRDSFRATPVDVGDYSETVTDLRCGGIFSEKKVLRSTTSPNCQ